MYSEPKDINRHVEDREKKYWTSFGKKGDEPPIKTLIKDLGNIHLLRIKIHLEKRIEHFNRFDFLDKGLNSTLILIENEIKFRKLDKLLIEKI